MLSKIAPDARGAPGLRARDVKVFSPMSPAEDRDVPASPEHVSSAIPRHEIPGAQRPLTAKEQPRPASSRVALLGAAGLFAAISWQPIIPFLPLHLSRIGFTAAQIGILMSLLSLAMATVELEVGRIAGVFGRRWTLLGGFLANTVATIWLAHAHAVAVAGALAAVGTARAMMWAPLFAAVADTASAQTWGRAFAVFWLWTSVAFLTGPALGGLIVARYGMVAVFYVGAAFSLLALPALIAVTDPARPTLRVTVAGAENILRVPAIFRLCVANLLYYSMTGIWLTFLPLYAAGQGVSVLMIGWVFTLQGLTYALVQIPTGRLADRLGPERLVIPALIGRSLLAGLAPLFHAPFAFLLAGALYGFVGGFLPVPLTTLMARLVPREQYTTVMGVYNSSGDLGFFLGPLLGGAAAVLGILAPFFLCVPLGLAGVAIGISGMAAAARSPELASL